MREQHAPRGVVVHLCVATARSGSCSARDAAPSPPLLRHNVARRRYTEAVGLPELRAAIADAHGVPREAVVVTGGAQSALFSALLLILQSSGGSGEVRARAHAQFL